MFSDISVYVDFELPQKGENESRKDYAAKCSSILRDIYTSLGVEEEPDQQIAWINGGLRFSSVPKTELVRLLGYKEIKVVKDNKEHPIIRT